MCRRNSCPRNFHIKFPSSLQDMINFFYNMLVIYLGVLFFSAIFILLKWILLRNFYMFLKHWTYILKYNCIEYRDIDFFLPPNNIFYRWKTNFGKTNIFIFQNVQLEIVSKLFSKLVDRKSSSYKEPNRPTENRSEKISSQICTW